MSKVEAHIIENGVFFRIRLKITQDFPFVRLPSTVSSFRASLLIMSVSLEPSTVSMEFSNWAVTSILAERAIYQRSLICKILLSPITSQFQWLGFWSLQNVLRLWRLAFHFLEFEKLEKSNGLRFEIAQGALSPLLELVVAEDALSALRRPLLSSCAHPQLLSALFATFFGALSLGYWSQWLIGAGVRKSSTPASSWTSSEVQLAPQVPVEIRLRMGLCLQSYPCVASSPSMRCFSSSLPVSPRSDFLKNPLRMNPHLRICF